MPLSGVCEPYFDYARVLSAVKSKNCLYFVAEPTIAFCFARAYSRLFVPNFRKVRFLRPPILIQTNLDMKKLFLLWAVLAVAISTTAQNLSYDDYLCDSLVQLGIAPACPSTVFTNVGATNSDIGFDNPPSCFNGGLATRDVWFSFVCSDTLLDYRITLTGVDPNPIENPQFAIYRGDCAFDGFAELLCAKAEIGEHSLFLDVQGLTPV